MNERRTISPEVEPEEVMLDRALRPQRLDDLIGQDRVRENLRILIEAAKGRNEPMEHALFYGPPGLGKCITADSYILTEAGWISFDTIIPKGIEDDTYVEHQLQIYGLNGLEPTSHIYSSGIQDTIRITTRSGFSIEGTPNHAIIVATPSGPQWKRLDAITCEDWIAINYDAQLWGPPQPVNYEMAVASGEQRHRVAEREVQFVHQALTKQLGRPPCAVELRYACQAESSPTPQIIAKALGLILSDGRRVKTQRLKVEIPAEIYHVEGYQFPTTITPEIAYLAGLLIGDGHFEKSGVCRIHNTDDELLDKIQALSQIAFNYTPAIKRSPSRTPFISFPMNIGRYFLSIGLLATTAAHKEIPAAIMNSPVEVVKACLQGLFDSDGNVWPEGYVEFSSRSRRLVEQIQLLLANMGIIAHCNIKNVQTKPHYNLFIGGQDAQRFHERIGFALSRKRQRAEAVAETTLGWSRSDIIPCVHEALRAVIKQTAPHTHELYKRLDHIRAGDRNVSRRTLQEYLTLIGAEEHTSPEMDTLTALCNPQIYWDPAETITLGRAPVYDFHVPIGHAFVANGFYNHNTTLAHIIANEMGANIRITAGPSIERAGDLAAILSNLREKEVLFIDEIHRLGKVVEEILYPAMEDFALDLVIGQGPGARTVRLSLPRFTVIGATTRLALLSAPLRTRFGATYRLDFYDQASLERIVENAARALKIPLEPAGRAEIARRGRGTPRVALRVLRRVRDYAQVRGDGVVTGDLAAEALALLEIDARGLDDLDRRVLHTIIEKFDGGPVGLETIAASVGEAADTIMDVVEPYLLQLGFIGRTPRGRVATRLAYEHLNIPYTQLEQATLF